MIASELYCTYDSCQRHAFRWSEEECKHLHPTCGDPRGRKPVSMRLSNSTLSSLLSHFRPLQWSVCTAMHSYRRIHLWFSNCHAGFRQPAFGPERSHCWFGGCFANGNREKTSQYLGFLISTSSPRGDWTGAGSLEHVAAGRWMKGHHLLDARTSGSSFSCR